MTSETSRALWAALFLVTGCAADDDDGNAPLNDAGDMPSMTTGEECFDDLAAPDTGFVELQRFRSEDGAVRIWRARQPGDRVAVGETFPYDLVRAWVEAENEPGTCVTQASALTYEFGHHNWSEEWSVTTDHARYIGRELYSNSAPDDADFGWTDSLEAKSASGATLFMVDLVDDGCESMPYNLNPCLRRMRTDTPPPGWGEE
jgi:hypothetical protein